MPFLISYWPDYREDSDSLSVSYLLIQPGNIPATKFAIKLQKIYITKNVERDK